MNKQKHIKFFGVSLLLSFLAFSITTLPTYAMGMGGMMGMMGNTQMHGNMGMGQHSLSDKHFIEQMIPHHQDAIEMAELALQKSEHQEIKALAQNIITSQSAEIDQMRSWYKAWYGTDVPQTSMMGMHQSDISVLESAEEFDKAFIEQMIPHHRMAVMMAQMLFMQTDRPEMKQLAQNIITTQNQEINQMTYWYNRWY